MKEFILKKFDHKNLNLDMVDFKDKQPTCENLAMLIWDTINGVR